MPSREQHRSGRKPNATPLADRLPSARRAKLLARIALEPHRNSPAQLVQFGEYAEHIGSMELDILLAEIEAMPPGLPGVRETRMGGRALRAMRSFLRNDPDGALAEWSSLIAEDPDGAAPAHLFRSQFHLVRGELAEALADVNRAIALTPENAQAYARRGEISHALGRDAEAVANFLLAVELNADSPAALSGMGVCRFLEGDWSDAIYWYTRAIRSAPRRSRLYLARALCFENEGRTEAAIADFDAAIALDPTDAAAFHGRGRCQKATSPTTAIADYTRSIELDAGESAVWSDRGRTNFLAGEYEEAERDATRAIEIDPTDAHAHFTRAHVRHHFGDVARALEDYDAAARLEPGESLYVTASVKARQQLGDAAALRADLDATIRLDPTAVEIRVMRARLLAKEGTFERALDDFTAALTLGARLVGSSPALPGAERASLHRERAEVLHALGRHDEAAEDEEQACELSPSAASYRP